MVQIQVMVSIRSFSKEFLIPVQGSDGRKPWFSSSFFAIDSYTNFDSHVLHALDTCDTLRPK